MDYNLDEVGAYIQSQESDYVARKGTGGQEKASKVNQVTQQDEPKDPPRRSLPVKYAPRNMLNSSVPTSASTVVGRGTKQRHAGPNFQKKP